MTYDHDILARWLQQSFGIRGMALSRLQSFLHGRTQQVCYNGQLSTVVELLFGVPQGSVLGSLLSLLYTAELFEITTSTGLVGHSYADDTQVYISAPAASASVSTQRFTSCVERIDEKQQTANERRQDTARVARNSTAVCQADHHRAPTAFCPRQAFVRSDRPWCQYRWSANYGRPHRRATPVVLIPTTPASDGEILTDFGGREDAGTHVRKQPS